MRIGYFGGSFDPPHRGHLAVACAARDHVQLDRVLLAPTARQPLKPGGPVAPWHDRLRMTELLCAGVPGLEASAVDGPQPDGQPNYTVDTLRRLRAELTRPPSFTASNLEPPSFPASISGCHPRTASASLSLDLTPALQLFAILGADAFLNLPQWREPDELLRLAEWIVVSRPGFQLPRPDTLGLTLLQTTHIHLLEGILNPITATGLRHRLKTGQPANSAIPEPVLAYIQAHHLYSA